MYIRVPRENVAPVDTGRTQTVQHHVSQRAGRQNGAPVLRSIPVRLSAPASQRWLEDSSNISHVLVSDMQPGGTGDTSVDTVDTEPHLEALIEHAPGRLAAPVASSTVEVKVLMDSGSGINAVSEELVETVRRQPEMM